MADRHNLSSKRSGINRPVFDALRVLAAAMVGGFACVARKHK